MAKCNTARKRQCQNWNTGLSTLTPMSFPLHCAPFRLEEEWPVLVTRIQWRIRLLQGLCCQPVHESPCPLLGVPAELNRQKATLMSS